MDFSKKIAGVPVVYLAGGAVAIMAIVAWRMKPSPDAPVDTVGTGSEATLDENGLADGADPYAGLRSNGTVIVQPAPLPEPVEPDRPDTNEEWIRVGAEWLAAKKNIPPTTTYSALSKYIEGKSRSTTEQNYIDDVIREKGFPPDPFTDSPPPSTSTPPPSGGSKPPSGGSKPPPVSSKPRGYGWYQVRLGDSAKSISAKYDISVNAFYAWNGINRLTIGEWVKVRGSANPSSGYTGK